MEKLLPLTIPCNSGFMQGKMHDAAMLMGSHLLERLENFAYSPTGQPMCTYGDPAYPLRVQLQGPFRNAVLAPKWRILIRQ